MAEIKKVQKKELMQLAELCKGAFKVNNVFSKSADEIAKYFAGLSKKATILVAKEAGSIVGCIAVEVNTQAPGHTLATFKHIVVHEGHRGKDIVTMLINEAEKLVGKGKAEIKVSENEKSAIGFYEKMGFKVEGTLESHYRHGEACYILGKIIQ